MLAPWGPLVAADSFVARRGAKTNAGVVENGCKWSRRRGLGIFSMFVTHLQNSSKVAKCGQKTEPSEGEGPRIGEGVRFICKAGMPRGKGSSVSLIPVRIFREWFASRRV